MKECDKISKRGCHSKVVRKRNALKVVTKDRLVRNDVVKRKVVRVEKTLESIIEGEVRLPEVADRSEHNNNWRSSCWSWDRGGHRHCPDQSRNPDNNQQSLPLQALGPRQQCQHR